MDFLLLLVATLVIAIIVSALVIRFFRGPMDKIFHRIIGEDIAESWRKFLTFALFVVGVSSGVNIWRLERFTDIERGPDALPPPVLTPESWGLEIYRTIIGSLAGLAWALLIFFVVALIAFVIVKRGEVRTKV